MKQIFFILFISTFFSCNSDKNTETENHAEEKSSLPDDYKKFYSHFHEDSLFQMQSIQWPLQGIQTTERDSNIIKGRFYHQKENWLMHRNLGEAAGYSKITKIIGEGLIEETLVDGKQQFGMKRRFAKIGKDWYLIYYSGLNHISPLSF